MSLALAPWADSWADIYKKSTSHLEMESKDRIKKGYSRRETQPEGTHDLTTRVETELVLVRQKVWGRVWWETHCMLSGNIWIVDFSWAPQCVNVFQVICERDHWCEKSFICVEFCREENLNTFNIYNISWYPILDFLHILEQWWSCSWYPRPRLPWRGTLVVQCSQWERNQAPGLPWESCQSPCGGRGRRQRRRLRALSKPQESCKDGLLEQPVGLELALRCNKHCGAGWSENRLKKWSIQKVKTNFHKVFVPQRTYITSDVNKNH